MVTDTLTVIADKGYYSARQFEKCEKANITAIVSKANHSSAAASEEYSKDMFTHDKSADTYICPQGQVLKRRQSRKNSKQKDYPAYSNQTACYICPVKDKCTRGKYRTIINQPLHEYARVVDLRTQQNMDAYQKRKQLVEHPFGTVKRSLGFTHFLTRGNESVRAESSLHFLAYNMRRVINILGTEEIAAAFAG